MAPLRPGRPIPLRSMPGHRKATARPAIRALGHAVGGTIVFAGGLALYNGNGIQGGLGVSGDTSCGDHNVAWRVRHALGMDKVPGGPTAKHNDAIVYDIGPNGKSKSGFGHPACGHKEAQVAQQIGASAGGAAPPK
jgi:hypothetical protein